MWLLLRGETGAGEPDGNESLGIFDGVSAAGVDTFPALLLGEILLFGVAAAGAAAAAVEGGGEDGGATAKRSAGGEGSGLGCSDGAAFPGATRGGGTGTTSAAVAAAGAVDAGGAAAAAGRLPPMTRRPAEPALASSALRSNLVPIRRSVTRSCESGFLK